MGRGRIIALLTAMVFLLPGCGEKENPSEPFTKPAIKLSEPKAGPNSATVEVRAIGASQVRYGLDTDIPLIKATGTTGPVTLELTIEDLQPLTDYTLYARGIGPNGEEGTLESIDFTSGAGASYVPSFADVSLVTLGWHNSNPPAWTKERFASHVSYKDADGREQWLFDSFLCIDGWDPKRNLSYSITPDRYSATKDSWEDLLEAWLKAGGALSILDDAIDAAAARIGNPRQPRYVIMTIPDPVRYQYFGNPSSSTTYWGSLDGTVMDFSNTAYQIQACKWYMDQCRSRFNKLKLKHLKLAGFYILSEELHLDPAFYKAAGQTYTAGKDDWNWQRKNWEIIVPALAEYAHSSMEGLWWIPYHLAPGYKVWRDLGFDCVFMQPNYYWDHDDVSHPLSATEQALRAYRIGIELEFEYSLVASVMADGRSGPDGSGSPTFYLKDVPMLRQRVCDYMNMYKRTGLYGQIPIAVYSGTDAWNQLATSTDPEDREMFLELCSFISQSPLKK